MLADSHVSLEEARIFLPPLGGVSLSHEQTWHVRWKGAYPRAELPRTVSRSYGAGGWTSEAALMFVLRTLWGWYTLQTGEPCPFDDL